MLDITFLKHSLDPYENEYGNTCIGYDHLLHKGVITENDESINEDTEMICYEMDSQSIINLLETTTQDFNDNQLTALISLILSIGIIPFRNSYMFSLLKKGKLKEAANQIKTYNKVNGTTSQELVSRRLKEFNKFNEIDEI
jgi:GH24 family phage-related lysozyme (muramidase)